VFLDDQGEGNFHPDTAGEIAFLHEVVEWINHKTANLDTLAPAVPSPFVRDAGFRIRLDTVYFHRDTHAWDCSGEIDAPYMRERYVDLNPEFTYRMKYQTLPVFLGANNPVVGGHSRGIGDKGYIGMRGFYNQYLTLPRDAAVMECARNLLHELGHCVGLMHNFRGGDGGDQCDPCDDNGCPEMGTSNNIMDLWPKYGHALSECQVGIIKTCLEGRLGNISDVLVNDSCYTRPGSDMVVAAGDTLMIQDTVYLHGSLEVQTGGVLIVSGYLSVPAGCGIHIREGGLLRIPGGTIGNLCGDLWSGIVVDNSPGIVKEIVFSDGCTIENAGIGLKINSSGVLNADGAYFRNCARGMVVAGLAGNVLVDNCNFLISKQLNHHEEGVIPIASITDEMGGNLTLTRCNFLNEPGTFLFPPDSSGDGIIFSGDSLSVAGSFFSQLTCGIRAVQAGELNIDQCSFTLNRCGVYSNASGYQLIRGSQFSMQRYNEGPTYGLVVAGRSAFDIKENLFGSEYGSGKIAGICLTDPGEENSRIGGNTFVNLPVGTLIHKIPMIEECLFTWSSATEPESTELKLGPHLLENHYVKTPVQALFLEDSTHGTAIGIPETYRLTGEIRATEWPVGGYWWYDKSCPLSVMVQAERIAAGTPESYGLFVLRNMDFPEANDLPEAAADSLRQVLQFTDRLRKDPGSVLTGDIYQDIRMLERYPLALASGYARDFPGEYPVESTRWSRLALAGMAGKPSAALSYLRSLKPGSSGEVYLLPPASGSALPVWPSGIFCRIVPPGDNVSETPGFSVRPIPARDHIRIYPKGANNPQENWTYQIFRSDGQLCQSGSISGWQLLEIGTGTLAAGVYFIRIFSASLNLGTQEFIIDP